MRSRLWLLTLIMTGLATAVLAAASLRVRAQEATPSDDDVNAIASQLYCPVCQSTPLDVCPTQACRQWRDLIRQMLAEGKSADEIKQYFVDNYGASVLSEPPRTGLNWLVYIVPPAAFLLGAFLLFRAFVLWKRQAQVAAPASQPARRSRRARHADDGYAARLEEELRKRQ